MTREERLKSCSICTKRAFDPKQGIVCGLTGEPANFNNSCSDFNEDPKEIKVEKRKVQGLKSDTQRTINKGRYALFFIGGLYFVVGFFEAFIMDGFELVFGIIDWIVASVFIGLGIWSYSKASLAMIIGLAFYAGIMLLLFALEPSSLIKGIIWKVFIIYLLIHGIKTAREEEAIQKPQTDDILDQI